jgi:hypothetical protein
MTEAWRNAPPYLSGAPRPLSDAERDRLPAHLAYADKYRFSADTFDQREAECDAIQLQRDWLAAECAAIDAEIGSAA